MTFTDNLAFGLFSISFASLMLFYVATSMYFIYRHKRDPKEYTEHMRSAAAPMMVIGSYLVLLGFLGQATWPLPGSYNILFFDPMVAFGMVILAFALSIRSNVKLEYAGFFGLLVGLMALIYGAEGYSIGLTLAPSALLALYFFYGMTGVFSYPAALIFDRLPGHKKTHWIGWDVLLALFWLSLLAAGLTSAYIGISAIPGHLISAP